MVSADKLHASSFLTFLVRHRKTATYLFVALMLVAFGLYRLSAKRAADGSLDFVKIQNEFASLSANQVAPQKAVEMIDRVMKKHQELQQTYDAPLAQLLIDRNEPDLAMKYAKRAFAVEGKSPYTEFAETSLLIAQEDYATALQRALTLNEQLKHEGGSVLRVSNALRIALLYEELGDLEKEKLAWRDLLTQVENPPSDPVERAAMMDFISSFQQGKISLVDYAKSRMHAN